MGELKSKRVLIVEDETLVGINLMAQLKNLGHEVVGQAATGAEALALFKEKRPDLVLVDIRMGEDEDGIQILRTLQAERRVPMIIVSAFTDPELIRRASEAGVFGYIKKPSDEANLPAQIEIAVTRFSEMEQLAKENEQLTQNLESRKLVERAKGILMKRANLSEPDAHKRLQSESQKRRVSIAELAKKIIESESILGGT